MKSQTECSICFEVYRAKDTAMSKCRHVVCAECSADVAAECPICRRQNPQWLGLKTVSCLANLIGDGSLDGLDSTTTALDRLRAIALARYHVRAHARNLLSALEGDARPKAHAPRPTQDSLAAELNAVLAQTQSAGMRLMFVCMWVVDIDCSDVYAHCGVICCVHPFASIHTHSSLHSIPTSLCWFL